MRGLAPAFSSNTAVEREQAEEPSTVGSDSDGEEFWGFSADEVQSIYTREVDKFRGVGALAADGITASTDGEWLN